MTRDASEKNPVSEPVTCPEDTTIHFAGQTFSPLLSGALLWREENTLLVADMNFEKMSSFAASGQLLPPHDTGATLARLRADIAHTRCRRVVCLGDSFHRDGAADTLSDRDRQTLGDMTGGLHWIWLAGNHDPAPHGLEGTCHDHIRLGPLHLTHQPPVCESVPREPQVAGLVAGHLHPAARIRIGGRTTRRRCFVHDDRVMILPAYGVSTGSLNILSAPFDGVLMRDRLQVTMIGKDRLYCVARRFLV